ncbi:GNAT family N-acetyltransferase [Actinacidiphila sp. ITFR-21]|uniref:GNAT family N-acetyltransferase n=1 Tax=Actinacidiphila sp. ITFR-21 TaxID=3075199 RepID=UPI00288C16DB|nr:GNAT family N-acetyltransferase [Streptomyces sp. ITFR-21]WNI17018.1 GNAT family N-acetyltransferase [Streptomyces sp. ITFR-21]
MSLDLRTVEEPDVPDWLRAVATGFHHAGPMAPEEVALRRLALDLERSRGVYDAGRCVATCRSMPRELTVPGGATLPASAITNVTVTSTHRRRGLAGRMMAAELAAARERGEPAAILIAAEYPIYGRFGFGPATWVTGWEVDLPRAALDRRYAGPDDGGRVDLATLDEVRRSGPALYDRVRTRTPGAVNRLPRWWDMATGEVVLPSNGPWKEPFQALHRDADGRIDGLAQWDVGDDEWPGKLPANRATVRQLIAATPAAERDLWRLLLSLDWVTRLGSGHRAPDDLLPLLLGDPRAARTETYADHMWARLLDTPAALAARTYAGAPTALVLDVQDPSGPAGGRFLLETDASGAACCAPTSAAPDLTLSAADLACLYLGDESPVRLAALGRLTEHRAEAARTADTLFRTPRRPWCPDEF